MPSRIEQAARGCALLSQLGGLCLLAALAAGILTPARLGSSLAGLLILRGVAGMGHGWAWRQRNPEKGRRVFRSAWPAGQNPS